MLIASETGFQFGRRSGNYAANDTKSQLLAGEAGVLSVLGLLVGFPMVMALTPFERRRPFVMETFSSGKKAETKF
jgi:hypothetical protein